jgi:hypothetical protein
MADWSLRLGYTFSTFMEYNRVYTNLDGYSSAYTFSCFTLQQQQPPTDSIHFRRGRTSGTQQPTDAGHVSWLRGLSHLQLLTASHRRDNQLVNDTFALWSLRNNF